MDPKFRTISDFSTDSPDELSRQLTQLEENVDRALSALGEGLDDLLSVTSKKTSSYQAQVGDLVIADSTAANVFVTLPVSTPQNAGRKIVVARASAANGVTVAVSQGTINGASTLALAAGIHARAFFSSGRGWYG